jgi:Fic family protein
MGLYRVGVTTLYVNRGLGMCQDDIKEVLNYRKATRSAKDWLKRGVPFNLTLICVIQNDLIEGNRGNDKHPGEIRKEQVWIGTNGCSMEDTAYVPPEPLGLKVHLTNLTDYMNLNDQEVLIQTAILHAQFEIIHHFCDSNGRTERILIPLFLWCKECISAPCFISVNILMKTVINILKT